MLTDIRKETDGSITIYLAMSLAALLSLYLVLMRGAGLGAARMQMDSVSHIAQNAALAEFHGELHSRYDLFMVDTSYGGPGGGNEVFEQHLLGYMEKNCVRKTALPLGGVRDWTSMQISDVNVTEGRYACDNAGRAVREQVYAYMSADPAGAVISSLLVTADQWRGLEISGREWKEETQKSREELRDALRKERDEQKEENRQKEEDGENVTEEEREAARVCRWIVYCPTEVFTSGQECGQIILTRIRKRMKSCLTDISMKRQETIPGHRRMGSFASRRNIFCAEKTLTAGTSKIRR